MDVIYTLLFDKVVQKGPEILISLVIFLAFVILSKILKKITSSAAKRLKVNNNLIRLLAKTVSVTVIIFGLVTALGTVGINITAIVASLGLTGFALGFALKDTISNILSGVLILMYKPFELDHYIKITGFEGLVVNIDLRYTELDFLGDKILIPNSKLFINPITVVSKEKKQLHSDMEEN
ncbi:MAG: mechanosensitive ion channel [Spirochaetes bacterium]|nr:MAG: mechanosensitive ion channel [Spirochaetota bacterium]RKX74842.1 MAG: mechanosensitive ion channel [Spirochaetota bacterium]RKX96857.1 MAG: mechanosensitive ion channel [Spirochaetota bacterium]